MFRMLLAVVRHAESVENADKYKGFYQARRPYDGRAAHDISRNVVGLTPRGFRQALWLADALADLTVPGSRVYTSTYRRAIDTAAVAFAGLEDGWPMRTPLLDEQYYGDATYMTKDELSPPTRPELKIASCASTSGCRPEVESLWSKGSGRGLYGL